MTPLYVHAGTVAQVIGISPHALKELARRHKLASVVECRRRLWRTQEVVNAIEADRKAAEDADGLRLLREAGLEVA